MTAPAVTQDPKAPTPPPPASSAGMTTTSTPSPTAPVIEAPKAPVSPFASLTPEEKDRLLATTHAAASAANQRAADLEQRLKAVETRPAVPEDLKAANKAFWDDPITTLRKEVTAIVEPLVEFTRGVRRESAYDTMRSSVAAKYPNLRSTLDNYGPQIEEVIRNSKVEVVTEQVLTAAAVQIAGAVSLGLIAPTAAPAPTSPFPTAPAPTPTAPVVAAPPATMPTPPHLRPSAAPGPQAPTPQLRELSELEKRLARENHMTDEEYLEMLSAPAAAVVHIKKGDKK